MKKAPDVVFLLLDGRHMGYTIFSYYVENDS